MLGLPSLIPQNVPFYFQYCLDRALKSLSNEKDSMVSIWLIICYVFSADRKCWGVVRMGLLKGLTFFAYDQSILYSHQEY